MYDYLEIPFIPQGSQGTPLKKLERLESEVFFLQELIELWYIDRKFEDWKLEDMEVPQKVLSGLKLVKMRKISLFSLLREGRLKERYYNNKFTSYIKKLSKIKVILIEWMFFLFILENSLYKKHEIHESLKMLFVRGKS